MQRLFDKKEYENSRFVPGHVLKKSMTMTATIFKYSIFYKIYSRFQRVIKLMITTMSNYA